MHWGKTTIKIDPFVYLQPTGQTFDAFRISAGCISALKSLIVVENTNIFFSSKCNTFVELRRVSLRYDNHKKFGLSLSDKSLGNDMTDVLTSMLCMKQKKGLSL
jgi:hypothetical protein